VARRFFDLSQAFPKEESYSFTDQGCRSCRSIGAQIAEAWAKRGYEKHQVSKRSDANGEQQERQPWIDTALDCGYLTGAVRDELVDELERIGRMLPSMVAPADLFCGPSVRCVGEGTVECFGHQSPITDHRSPE